jgi:hypothetical protein
MSQQTRHWPKAQLIYERVELYLDEMYRHILEGLDKFWTYSDRIHESEVRGLSMYFGWHSGADVSILRSKIDDGILYLEKMLGSDSIDRKQTEDSDHMTVEVRAHVRDGLAERWELTVYDEKMNSLLDDQGILANFRMDYLNYQREAYRLKKEYGRVGLQDRLDQLKAQAKYAILDRPVLEEIDRVVCPEAL